MTPPRARELLVGLMRAANVNGATLSRDMTQRGVTFSETTLNYYTAGGPKGFKGATLPRDKVWSEPLMEALIARGAPEQDVRELFGMQSSEDISKIYKKLDQIEKTLKILADTISRLPQNQPDDS